MIATKRGIANWLLVTAAAFGLINLALAQERKPIDRPAAAEVRGVVKSVKGDVITVVTSITRDKPPEEKTFTVAKDAEVVTGAAGGRDSVGFKEAQLATLSEGVQVSLTLGADQKTVVAVVAELPSAQGVLKAVNAEKKTLTIEVAVRRGEGREVATEEKTLTLAPDAEIAVDDGRGKRFSLRSGKLAELAAGALVNLRLSLDRKQVHSILAEGPTFQGTIKALDAGKKTLTLTVRPVRGDDAGEEKTLSVAGDAVVMLDDGRGRRLSVKEGKLADILVGSVARVKMSTDQDAVMNLRIEGPTVTGMFKGADPEKGTLVVSLFKGRGEDPEDRTLTVAKDARVVIDGAESKLVNLKAGDNGTMIQARLSLDQKTVQSIMAQAVRPRQ